jgi:hypothetical protein
LIVTAAVALAGCSSTIHKKAALGDVNTLSIDAKQRLVLVGNAPDGHRISCAEPSPDALVAAAAALAAQGSAKPSAQGQSAGEFAAALGGGRNESAASIGLRTQSITLLRDGYYRLCEGLLNGVLDKESYYRVLTNIDTFMAVVVAIDAIGGTPVAPTVTVAPGKVTTKVNADGTTESTVEPPATGNQVVPARDEPDLSKIQAAEIANIVSAYLEYRRRVPSTYVVRAP